MRVSDAMSMEVHVAHPNQSLHEVAELMAGLDVGAIPVEENGRLVGMITDRDIAIRAVAANKAPNAQVREVMSRGVKYCYEDEKIDHVVNNMAEIQVRRLPVVDRDKHLVGIISLADIAIGRGPSAAGKAVAGISRPRRENAEPAAA